MSTFDKLHFYTTLIQIYNESFVIAHKKGDVFNKQKYSQLIEQTQIKINNLI